MPRILRSLARIIGRPFSFVLAFLAVLLWAVLGPHFQFSNDWQFVLNTGTGIFTFLMLFLLQHSQDHDIKAVHIKLDELIQRLPQPRNEVAGIEKTEKELD